MVAFLKKIVGYSIFVDFVGIKHGYHIPGGTLAFVDVTQDQCIRKCARNPDCLALDYNIVILECWFHDSSTYCKEPTLKLGCVHVKRIPCITGKSFAVDVEIETDTPLQFISDHMRCGGRQFFTAVCHSVPRGSPSRDAMGIGS